MTDMQLIPSARSGYTKSPARATCPTKARPSKSLNSTSRKTRTIRKRSPLQVTTSTNKVLTYRSEDYETWPSVIRRLFREHTAVRDRRA